MKRLIHRRPRRLCWDRPDCPARGPSGALCGGPYPTDDRKPPPCRAERFIWSDGDYTLTLPNGHTL